MKLYKIANELLQTERAYVKRLHLLEQVSDTCANFINSFTFDNFAFICASETAAK